jgi:two-component system, response regulator
MMTKYEDSVVDILFIEDNPQDVELTLRALKKNNIANKIHIINDGEEALDYLFCRGQYENRNIHNAPKVVILDLKLPKVDGLEILRLMKGDEDLKIIPVVVLTSSREERDIIESYKIGVNSYIVKPVDFEKFIDAVKELGYYWLLINQQIK